MSGIDIKFRASGQQEITGVMDQLRQKSNQATAEMINNAKKQADGARDQLKIVEDQIKALERKKRLETSSGRLDAASKRDQLKSLNTDEYQKTLAEIESKSKSGEYSKFKSRKESKKAEEDLNKGNQHADAEYKDQLNLIRETERQDELHTKLLRDNIETIKSTSNVEVNQMRKGSDSLLEELDDNASPMRQMARDVAAEKYLNEQSKPKKDEKQAGLFTSLLGVDSLNKLLGTGQRFSQTKDGIDMISEAGQTIGQTAGAILGGVLGSLIGNAKAGVALGTTVGGAVGGGIGQFEERRFRALMEFQGNKNRLEATTQKSVDQLPDLSSIGVSGSDMLSAIKQISVAAASFEKAVETSKTSLSISKGAGVEQDTLNEYLTLFRGTQKDIGNLVAAVMDKGKGTLFQGGDYSFLNEFLKKMSQLQNQMRQNQEEVSSGTAYSILEAFNSVGGMFRARDTRSTGLISTINQSLANPGSDSLKAASFLAMRKMHPGMSMAGIIEEQQKGLASPHYFSAMMGYIDQLGGDKSTKIMNVAGMFGLQNNFAAARKLLENRGKLSKMMGGKEFKKGLEDLGINQDFTGMAASRTTLEEKQSADIKNKLLVGDEAAVKAMADATSNAIMQSLSGSTIYMQNGYIKLSGKAPVPKQNTTIVPAAHRSTSGADLRTSQGRQEALSNGDFAPKL